MSTYHPDLHPFLEHFDFLDDPEGLVILSRYDETRFAFTAHAEPAEIKRVLSEYLQTRYPALYDEIQATPHPDPSAPAENPS